MLGLNPFIMNQCPKCDQGMSLSVEEMNKFKDKTQWKEVIACRNCNYKYEFLEGVIKGIISDNPYMGYIFESVEKFQLFFTGYFSNDSVSSLN